MARTPRSEVFEEDTVGCYHCINRCVRRAFLCGNDPVTGRSFNHRKAWIRERLQQLAGIFGIDVLEYAVMSNHFHVVLRNRPDVVESWSDEQVARRWWNLFPQHKDSKGRPANPKPHELRMLTSDRKRLQELRRRLSHISWFMRCLAENIARRSNREDQITGRFWSGRFKAVRILDESALLACSVYVDLNPIRAGIARTPESSRFTSAYDRIRSRRRQRGHKKAVRNKRRNRGQTHADNWLSPLTLDERNRRADGRPRGRASNKGFLPMTLEDYLRLLDWTGHQIRQGKSGHIPSHLAPILQRLKIVPQSWTTIVTQFGCWFGTAAGRVETLAVEAARRQRAWLGGVSASRTAFA
jgi:REP element-mobilizing transposase RayT